MGAVRLGGARRRTGRGVTPRAGRGVFLFHRSGEGNVLVLHGFGGFSWFTTSWLVLVVGVFSFMDHPQTFRLLDEGLLIVIA